MTYMKYSYISLLNNSHRYENEIFFVGNSVSDYWQIVQLDTIGEHILSTADFSQPVQHNKSASSAFRA